VPGNLYDYAVIRVVPRVDRGEFVNAGVILSCAALSFLEARFMLDRERMLLLHPGLDMETVSAQLEAIGAVCRGSEHAGPIGLLPQRERFLWLVAPRSTIVQISDVHTGFCESPGETLDRLLAKMVLPPGGG